MTTGRNVMDEWLPVEYGDEAIEKVKENSAIEAYARTEPMAEATKNVPRFSGFTVGNVAKGAAYSLSDTNQDRIDLIARKVGGAAQLAEEDITGDLQTDPLQPLRNEAGSNLALNYDNSCLGVTAASNGTTIKYNSVYREVRTSGAGGGFDAAYTADDNYKTITTANLIKASAAAPNEGYFMLSTILGKYEIGRLFEDQNTVVIADPRLKASFRNMRDPGTGSVLLVPVGKDTLGRPQYEFFGYPIRWSRGAVTSFVDTEAPTGNSLLIVGNSRMLIRGTRSLTPQIPADTFGWAMQRSGNGPGFLSDECYVKAAFRRAFAVGSKQGVAVLEVTP